MCIQTDVSAYVEAWEWGQEDNGMLSPERWERLRRRWSAATREPERFAGEMRRAYEEATGTLLGCD
jgi:hypothetical protein